MNRMPLANSNIDNLTHELFEKLEEYLDKNGILRVREAFDFAKSAHEGQFRKSGEHYIIHPVRVAKILGNLHAEDETIMAALLHDVIEDTKVTADEVKKRFGKTVTYLVDGVTKLSKQRIASLEKFFAHSAHDLRVILIKLADRLDNMRTLRFIAKKLKRERIAQETLEIYVPIANLLGIGIFRNELENLCFEFLHPADFADLKQKIDGLIEECNFVLEETSHIVEKELERNFIAAEIIIYKKSLYGIYRKSKIQKNALKNLNNIVAIQIITNNIPDCYKALGIIHRLFKPKLKSMKDYIAIPKPNGYQALHTTVFGLNSNIVEFHIQTEYMHMEAEYGIAAHYFYKNLDEAKLSAIMRQRSSWVQCILELQKNQKDSAHLIENLKLDILQDRILLFSPKGDVVNLPRGASALDFAYAIHSGIGNHAYKAEINSTLFPVTTALNTGDVIKIITKQDILPEPGWLKYVKTALAIGKIKENLKLRPHEEKIIAGKNILQKAFEKIGKKSANELNKKGLKLIAQKTAYRTLDELAVAVSEGETFPRDIIEVLQGIKRKKGLIKPKPLSRTSLKIIGDNSKNQFSEILRILCNLNIPVERFIIDKSWLHARDRCRMTIITKDYKQLVQAFETLEQLDGIEKIKRA